MDLEQALKKIEDLQEEAKEKEKKYEDDLKELKKNIHTFKSQAGDFKKQLEERKTNELTIEEQLQKEKDRNKEIEETYKKEKENLEKQLKLRDLETTKTKYIKEFGINDELVDLITINHEMKDEDIKNVVETVKKKQEAIENSVKISHGITATGKTTEDKKTIADKILEQRKEMGIGGKIFD